MTNFQIHVIWLLRAILILVLLEVVLTKTAHCEGWGHHHVQGAAVVMRSPDGGFIAAYEMEDFDPQHTPEMKVQTLARLTLVPVAGYAHFTAKDSTEDVTLTPTESGHTIMQWEGWQIELTPADYTERKWVASFAGNGSNMEGADFKKTTVRRRMIIGQHSPDTLSITITDAEGGQ